MNCTTRITVTDRIGALRRCIGCIGIIFAFQRREWFAVEILANLLKTDFGEKPEGALSKLGGNLTSTQLLAGARNRA